MKLTYAKIAEIGKADVREIKVLTAAQLDIDCLEDLNVCVELQKLDLSKNKLDSNDGLEGCASLTWLNISNNAIDSLKGLGELTELLVLNASYNRIATINFVQEMRKLKALVLTNNRISLMENLSTLADLNTLILSHNKIQEIKGIRTLKNLTKLGLAHNQIRLLCSFESNPNLRELRLNDNKISTIPTSIVYSPNLQVLDLGNNAIREFSGLEPLGNLLHLFNLNLQGNPVCKLPGYNEHVKKMIPSLRIFDGERFDPKFVQRKELKQSRSLQAQKNAVDRQSRDEDHTSSKPSVSVAPEKMSSTVISKDIEEKNDEIVEEKKVNVESKIKEKAPHVENQKNTTKNVPKRGWDDEQINDENTHAAKFTERNRSGVVGIINVQKKTKKESKLVSEKKNKSSNFSVEELLACSADSAIPHGWD